MKVKAVIFDLDGTLLDTLEDLKNAVNHALETNGLPMRTLEEVRQFVGNGVRNLMIRAVDLGEDNPQFEKIFGDFKEYYQIHCNDNTKPYNNIIPLLQQLKGMGIKMAIVSNKLDPAVKSLNEIFFEEYMSSAIGEMEGVSRKPAPDMVYKAIGELGVSKEESVYVGDSDVDLQTSKNAGLPHILVTWGFRDKEFLQGLGGKIFVDTPQEIIDQLEKF